ncbi:hypothetical protein [Alteromonas sp. a30]|uniref:hypothetical protein n=1 Tax=Alteromonas sp. a30 TaxID=2730917 RepID=UPI0022812D53|nr:hypothetical protein [Alteromonas sp. a30]MCY7295041.1 hypothetical protein [Alteromonas sp. a30]
MATESENNNKTTKTLSKAIETLKDAAADFSNLTVTTYTGDLKLLLGTSAESTDPINTNNLNFQNILNNALKAKVDGNLKVVCFNSYQIDGDAVVFRADDLSPEEMQKFETAHNAAIKAGQDTRESILNLLKDSVGLVLK